MTQDEREWAYQAADGDEPAVIDFTHLATDLACTRCGAPAYIQATAYGAMRVRWKCEHSHWADACDEAEREALP